MDFAHAFEQTLVAFLPSDAVEPCRLHAAMRYATLGGGKRLRARLVYATGACLGVPMSALHTAAVAVELIHAYSLVHDDLPCMDNDDLRRGKPTVHKAFDEATALLVGDALQTLAFEVLVSESESQANNMPLSPVQQLAQVAILARASGSMGMAGGQAIDCASVGLSLSLPQLQTMHALKTGALIAASVQLAAACVPLTRAQTAALTTYAQCIGLAFQIQDDVLDATGDTATLGKQAGADAALNKPTYVSLLGLEQAQAQAQMSVTQALSALAAWGSEADDLRAIAQQVVARKS